MELFGYPAVFYQEAGDDASQVRFPGLDLVTWGETLEQAREMARECLSCHLQDDEPVEERAAEEGEEMIYPDLPIALALTIRKMRKAARLNQTEAARRVGVSQAVWSKWEDPSRCNATAETIERIARAFGRRVEISFPEAS